MYMQIDAYMHACVSKLESKGIYVGMLVCMLACLHRFMLALSMLVPSLQMKKRQTHFIL